MQEKLLALLSALAKACAEQLDPLSAGELFTRGIPALISNSNNAVLTGTSSDMFAKPKQDKDVKKGGKQATERSRLLG